MREIRFRAWNKRDCRWESPEHMSLSLNGQLFETLGDYANFDIREQDFDVQQFTGLKDKYDREIYEGDILTNDFGDIQEVRYANGRWACVLHKRATSHWPAQFLDCVYMGWIVIGNVHEHPESLRGGDRK